MKRFSLRFGVFVLILGVIAGVVVAQRGYRGRRGYRRVERDAQGNLKLPSDRAGIDDWDNDPEFLTDTFTFVRVRYYSRPWGSGGGWAVDWPDSDLNFSFRLQQLTSMKVHPDPVNLELNDPRLFDYPFLYMVEPGRLEFADQEVMALRRYLTNGGFLMVDDFWGEDEWYNFATEIRRVFPDRKPEEVPLEHEIFHCVYDVKEKYQIPSIGHAMSGRTAERWDAQTAHYKAIFDDDDRIMVFICHNTDLGDGWEREGENEWYFREFSEKRAYPLGINIVVYAMTH
jgi:hypothetical protein